MDNIKRIEEVLTTEEVLISTATGYSMYPMLRDRKDTIVVRRPQGRLKKYDVALYKTGSLYILHRVLEVKSDSYIIRGDNCDKKEYGIKDEQILGVLTGFYRGDKWIDINGWKYKLYVRMHQVFFPMWWLYRLLRRKGGELLRKIRKDHYQK